jgi:hypothetical protein
VQAVGMDSATGLLVTGALFEYLINDSMIPNDCLEIFSRELSGLLENDRIKRVFSAFLLYSTCLLETCQPTEWKSVHLDHKLDCNLNCNDNERQRGAPGTNDDQNIEHDYTQAMNTFETD